MHTCSVDISGQSSPLDWRQRGAKLEPRSNLIPPPLGSPGMYVYVCVCMYMHSFVSDSGAIDTCVRTYIHTCMHIYIYYMHMYVCMYMYVYAFISH